MEVEKHDQDLATLQVNHDLIDDHMMDVEMSVGGAHRMIWEMKDDVQELQSLVANAHNQVEAICSEDIT